MSKIAVVSLMLYIILHSFTMFFMNHSTLMLYSSSVMGGWWVVVGGGGWGRNGGGRLLSSRSIPQKITEDHGDHRGQFPCTDFGMVRESK